MLFIKELGGSTKKDAVRRGHRSVTVLGGLIDSTDKGAIMSN